jgi:hypothetical protein
MNGGVRTIVCHRGAKRRYPARMPVVRRVPVVGCCLLLLAGCTRDEQVTVGRVPLGGDGSGGVGGEADTESVSSRAGRAGAGGGEICAVPAPQYRYGFSGTGVVLSDSIGSADGAVLGGGELDGSGELALDGVDDYVDLPNGLISGTDALTVMVWVRRSVDPGYIRVFDFGTGSDGEDPAEGLETVGTTYLALTPRTGYFPPNLAALVSTSGASGEVALVTDSDLDDLFHQLTVTVTSQGTLSLYQDGSLLGRVPSSVDLADIQDDNNWLGRSQYDADPYFDGAYDELRIYHAELPACAVLAAYRAGPDD